MEGACMAENHRDSPPRPVRTLETGRYSACSTVKSRMTGDCHVRFYGEFVGLEYGNVLVYLSAPGHQGLKRATGQGQLYIFCDEVDQLRG